MKLLIMIVGLAILATSCFKKGCRDIDAINYNKKAKRNDGSCEYYSKMKLSGITVLNFSSVNTNGLPWDPADDPDCYIRIRDNANNIMHQSVYVENQSGQITWTFSPAITITDFLGVTLQMRDYDVDYTNGGSEKMIETLIPIHEYTSSGSNVVKEETGNYPDSFEFSEAGATFVANVSWE